MNVTETREIWGELKLGDAPNFFLMHHKQRGGEDEKKTTKEECNRNSRGREKCY